MLNKRLIFFPVLLFSVFGANLHASSEDKGLSVDFKMGFNYLNAEGLNKITQGLDTGYGTTFGNVRIPLSLSGGFMFNFGRSRLGLEMEYEFANRSSYSSIYNITESIKYSAFPLGLRYQYEFYRHNKWTLVATVSTGVMQTWFSMRNQPSLSVTNSSYESGATAWYFSPNIELIYALTPHIGLNALFGSRYAKTGKFKYTTSDGRHNNGDYVVFSDGSNLTMDLSGLKFLLGMILRWS